MNPYNKEIPVEEIILEKFKFALAQSVDPEFPIDIEADYIIPQMASHITYRFKTEIAGQKLEDFQYPANWKEAFKERWFPKWLKDKFPVKYSTIELKALYPQIRLPKNEYPPIIHMVKNPFREGQE